MISTFLAENFVLTRIVLTAILVLAVVGAFVLARATSPGRTIAAVLALVGGVLVLVLTFSPDVAAAQGDAVCNLTPRSFISDALNMGLFMLPALFAVIASRRVWVVALAVPVGSALIELVQYLTPAFGRRCDIDDWLANLIGGLIGVVLGVIALRAPRRTVS